MKKILLVNPPIYDFSAFDFWLKPYGLLSVAGRLRGRAELFLFDFMDRNHPSLEGEPKYESDRWGRGKFPASEVEKPAAYSALASKYRRYGLEPESFRAFLESHGPFDTALIQTSMTYWYPGVKEVLDCLRQWTPGTQTVLGGTYATICPEHARSLGAGLVIEGFNLDPLWNLLELEPDPAQPPLWEAYDRASAGVIKLSDGCPFRCTYCSVPQFHPPFRQRPAAEAARAFRQLSALGVRNIVFYDDALLFRYDQILRPFLESVRGDETRSHFHTPNALNARFVTRTIAREMVEAGFEHFYLGFESDSVRWQKQTGGKVYPHELERAVRQLEAAGACLERVLCYLIIGHPASKLQELEASMRFASSLGIQVMLSEFSPIPGTPDGEACRDRVDLDEPLSHNKFFFCRTFLGPDRVQELKSLCRELNRGIRSPESFSIRNENEAIASNRSSY